MKKRRIRINFHRPYRVSKSLPNLGGIDENWKTARRKKWNFYWNKQKINI
ncbi:MAG: hypothetical protein MRERC_2c145 [Mycoplasmataceae bacterium RC_NB112A]|nr:MAG: hypothetical protein MRERC_2c145 [Mycoplasmataceae bacterium RC_NB112A]